MLRRFALSVVIILLLSSGAFAFIGQVEGFSIEANNLVGRAGRRGSAEGGNLLAAYHEQMGYDACRGTMAIQKEGGVLGQYASAVGRGGRSGVGQKSILKKIRTRRRFCVFFSKHHQSSQTYHSNADAIHRKPF